MKKLLILFLLVSPCLAGTSRHVDGTPMSTTDKAAINFNFQRIDGELSNSVHKSSTETIHGIKYLDQIHVSTLGITNDAPLTPLADTLYADMFPKARATFDGGNVSLSLAQVVNISTITKNGTGDYTLTWIIPFASSTYTVVSMAKTGARDVWCSQHQTG